ncbi:WD40 repeat domain-containing serine/threonine protein kinase [Haloferula rosea]|uniref:Protein kinase n=1 Tax=Haloferula rosea TaxID=490093 RepID=A0A934RDK4_9BACT|nr:serine/threonine-protein kinase [Haloferula rosea]MBK1827289.1 protein kinase [Haloferula rosea]
MSSQTTCPKCNATHPEGIAGGMCPHCLLAGLLETGGSPRLGECEGDSVGPYELIELLGEGGMGSVWRARQLHPVEREVALKIIRLGMDTREVVSRFDSERQSLAMMDHPGIARVYDAGATEEGRPYFAMELVGGEPVTNYCIYRSLNLEKRLRLFLEICEAVEHAHRKGIIHRDLKPSNVLVVETPEGPRPKVIDFGIAKTLETENDGRTFVTRAGHAIGTPGYMSPEQAGAEADVDTRSDVYSLGALLYEMLSGVPPLGKETFREIAYVEVLRLIRDTDPPRPSTRLGHASEPGARPPLRIARDLDRIVMKALSRERERRYGGATSLGEDVRRFLDHEPVSATDPTLAYRVGKFIRKHPLPVGLSVLMLLGGIIATLLISREAGRARLAAESERTAREETLGALADAYRNNGLAAARSRHDALAALWFTEAADIAAHDEQRTRANRLRANLHTSAALLPVRKFARKKRAGARLMFDDSSRFLHEGWFGVGQGFFDLKEAKELDFGLSVQAGWLLPGAPLAVISDGSEQVQVRDLTTLEVVEAIRFPEVKVTGLWCDASGNRLVAGDSRLRVWDRAGEAFVHGVLAHPEPVRYARFSPAGDRLLTVDKGDDIRVFALTPDDNRLLLGPLRVEGAAGYDVLLPDFVEGGEMIRVRGRAGMRHFRVTTGELVARLPHLDRAFDFTGDGELFGGFNMIGETRSGAARVSKPFGGALFLEDDSGFYGTGNGQLYNLAGAPLGQLALPGAARGFSPDGTLMASTLGGHLAIDRLARPEPFHRIHAPEAGRLTFTSDGSLFASAGWSGAHPTGTATRAYRVDDGSPAGPQIDTGRQHLSGLFFPGTTHLLTGGRTEAVGDSVEHESVGGGGVLQLWDAVTGQSLAGPLALPSEPWAMAHHPGQEWIAVICRNGSVLKLRPDLGGFEELLKLDFQLGMASAEHRQGHLVFSEDGARLYANLFGSPVWAIDPAAGEVIFETPQRLGQTMQLAVRGGVLFCPTARAEDEWLFDAATGETIALDPELKPHLPLGSGMSADGREVVFSGVTRVSVVDLATRSAIGPGLRSGKGWLSYSTFVPDTPWVLTASTANSDVAELILWDRCTGTDLAPRWDLRGSVIADLKTTGDGSRAVLAIRGAGYVVVDLDEIRASETWQDGLSQEDRRALAELRAGKRLVDGTPGSLDTPDAWLPLWNDLYSHHPEQFPLKPAMIDLLRWHRNQEVFHGADSPPGRWHRARVEALGGGSR